MILSFGGIILIAMSNSLTGAETSTTDSGDVVEEGYSSGMQTLGCCLIFLTSWCYAVVSILTRKMQRMNFAVMLFYYAIMAMGMSLGIVLVESWIKGEPLRFWAYNGEQLGYSLLLSLVNFIGLNCQTIALQNERSGFITLLGYIGLVYAFLGDIFIFNEKLAWLELVGIAIVLVLNISLIVRKMTPAGPIQPQPNQLQTKTKQE